MQPQEIAKRLGLKELKEQPDPDRLMRNTYSVDVRGRLTGLNLSDNGLTNEQVSWIWELSGLEVLILSENPSLQEASFTGDFSKLIKLDLSECGLTELHLTGNFSALKYLYLQKNRLTGFSIEGDTPVLEVLDLAGNQLQSLEIHSDLVSLMLLYLQGGNWIVDLSFLAKASNLQTLNLAGNGITDLQPILPLMEKGISVRWDHRGSGILLKDCPLGAPPPEIVQEGNEAVLNYFRETEEQGTDQLYEAKLLIVGEGSAGKTSLCRRLLDPSLPLPEESETTKGIDIHQFEFPMSNGRHFRLNVWDFGGQEIYHATHQFFLTKRSLYILLDDTRKDHKNVQDEGFKYWLEVIELLGDKSPVLIFQNEKGGRSKLIDMSGIKGRFDNVKERYSGNLEDPDSVAEIRDAIPFFARQLPHVGESLPKKWITIREELEQLGEKEPYISQKRYFDIYRQHLEDDRQKALHLSRYLHDLGVFLHFQDDDLLARTVILQNTWATEAVFKILDDEIVKGKLGRFDVDDCRRIWADSEYADMHPELRALMMKFELCYPLADTATDTWLAPGLLPPSKPEGLAGWKAPGDLTLRYRYDFLPKGMINRLMVRQHRFVKQPEYGWKNGALFERGDTQLLAEVSQQGNELILRARGPERKELLSVISSDLDALNESFPGLPEKVDKRIPCICKVCLQSATPEYYAHRRLLQRKAKGNQTIECRESADDVSVMALLDGLEPDRVKVEKMVAPSPKGKRVFFSYSKHDRSYLDQLQRHLAGLRRSGRIQPWDDRYILPGEEWDEKIKEELAQADIILLLISADFLATDYIWEVEVMAAMQRHERKEAVVVPIILRSCDWEQMPFGKLNGLPGKAKPVESYSSRDEAWLEVVKGVERVL